MMAADTLEFKTIHSSVHRAGEWFSRLCSWMIQSFPTSTLWSSATTTMTIWTTIASCNCTSALGRTLPGEKTHAAILAKLVANAKATDFMVKCCVLGHWKTSRRPVSSANFPQHVCSCLSGKDGRQGQCRTSVTGHGTALTVLVSCRYVPLGLSEWFKGCGVQNVHELGWWQEVQHPGSPLTLACLPAQVSCYAHQQFELADNSTPFPGSDWCSFVISSMIECPS